RSVPQMPQARTRTRTSSSPGTGTGRSWSSNRCGATSTVAVILSGIAMVAPFVIAGIDVGGRVCTPGELATTGAGGCPGGRERRCTGSGRSGGTAGQPVPPTEGARHGAHRAGPAARPVDAGVVLGWRADVRPGAHARATHGAPAAADGRPRRSLRGHRVVRHD